MVSVFVLFLSAPSFEQAQKEKISAAVQRKSASAFFAVHNMVSAPCVETIIQFFANMSSIKKLMTGEGVCGIMTVEAVTVHSIWQEMCFGFCVNI